MKSEEFVSVVKLRTSDAAVKGVLQGLEEMEEPTGRSPAERILKLSRWYHQLPEADRHMLHTALREAAE